MRQPIKEIVRLGQFAEAVLLSHTTKDKVKYNTACFYIQFNEQRNQPQSAHQ